MNRRVREYIEAMLPGVMLGLAFAWVFCWIVRVMR